MHDQSSKVHDHFSTEWKDLDKGIEQVIPFYIDSLQLLVDVLRHSKVEPNTILDLGIGTGNLAARLLSAFPNAHLTGVDFVPAYIDIARHRLAHFGERVTLICEDITQFKMPESCDVVVTSFVFHHLENSDKRRLYQEISNVLTPRGMFINADFVDSPSQFFSAVFDESRKASMRERDLTDDFITSCYVDHRKLEIPVPVEAQMKWLLEAGFSETECFWKYLNLATFCGRK